MPGQGKRGGPRACGKRAGAGAEGLPSPLRRADARLVAAWRRRVKRPLLAALARRLLSGELARLRRYADYGDRSLLWKAVTRAVEKRYRALPKQVRDALAEAFYARAVLLPGAVLRRFPVVDRQRGALYLPRLDIAVFPASLCRERALFFAGVEHELVHFVSHALGVSDTEAKPYAALAWRVLARYRRHLFARAARARSLTRALGEKEAERAGKGRARLRGGYYDEAATGVLAGLVAVRLRKTDGRKAAQRFMEALLLEPYAVTPRRVLALRARIVAEELAQRKRALP